MDQNNNDSNSNLNNSNNMEQNIPNIVNDSVNLTTPEVNEQQPENLMADNAIESNPNLPKEKKKRSKTPIIILIIVILGLGGYFAYTKLLVNSENVYETAFNNGYKNLSNMINYFEDENIDYDINKDNIYNKISLNIDSNIAGFENYNEYPITLETALSAIDNKFYMNLNLEEDKDELLNIAVLLKENNLYLESKKLINDVLLIAENVPFEFDLEENSFDIKKFDKLLELTSDAMYDALDKDNFETESNEIKIDGEDVKVTSHIYKFKGNDLEEYFKDLYNSLIENDEYIKLLSELNGYSEDETIESLENILNSSTEELNGIELTLEIYTGGLLNSYKGTSIIMDDTQINFYEIDKNNTQISFEVLEETLDIFIKKNDDGYEINSRFSDIELDLNYENKVVSDTELETNIELKIDIAGQYMKINLDSLTSIGKEIPEFNTDNYKVMDEDDISDISENLIDILDGTPFSSLLSLLETNDNDNLDTSTNDFLINANSLFIAADNAYEDNNEEYSCFTVEYLDQEYDLDLPSSYIGIVYTDDGYFFDLELEDEDNNLKIQTYIFADTDEVEENSSTVIATTCPSETSPR